MSVVGALFGFAAGAADADFSISARLDTTRGVTLVQPPALARRLMRSAEAVQDNVSPSKSSERSETKSPARGGSYRVEVFSDNTRQAKNHALARQRNVQSRFPQYNVQLVFESPFWRVKVGGFSSRSDAEAAMAEIKAAFPAYSPYLRIVRN